LTWIGKDQRPKLEPRILIEDAEKSYHAATRREGDIFDNMLIHGDHLLALKALEGGLRKGRVVFPRIEPIPLYLQHALKFRQTVGNRT
jgi:adenine-specific DNA-methyltransferase